MKTYEYVMVTLDRPKDATVYPSPFIPPSKKDKAYHLQACKAIYWTGWQTYNNPYGNYYRDLWDDNRRWARGIQGSGQFAVRPPAKNDHTKNPLLKHINFSAVNEMVKYCDIFVTMLEQSDLEITATAINPAAAAKRNEIKTAAKAYMELRPFYEELDQAAGQPISPKNPIEYDFETQQELETFFNIGFKLKQELLVELGNEAILNESDWDSLRKMIAEDLRDTGYYMFSVDTDTNNKIRVNYIDPVNSGWEDYRGHKVKQLSRFWTIDVKTGAQIVAEAGNQLTKEELYQMAEQSAGKYGNPLMPSNTGTTGTYGYINSDAPYNLWFFDNWKFAVLRCTWEDWDIYNYLRQKRGDVTVSYAPVDYDYQIREELNETEIDGGFEVKETIEKTHVHHYRQCVWVIGTNVCYNWGKVPNCPRNPYDVRYALSPVKIYRSTGAPFSQRLKSLAQVGQNAWYKLQNEIARARPSGVSIDLRKIDNVVTLDGKKMTRYHVLELFNQEGTLVWSSRGARDDMGNTMGGEPITPAPPVDINAMQRWINIINECSYRMQVESGLNEFAVAATQNPEQSATAVKAGIASAAKSIQQYADAILIAGKEIAIDATGKLQQLIKHGLAGGYISSIGESILKDGFVNDDVTIYTYGIRVAARPTFEQRQELKAEIRKAFSGLGTPTEGSPYLSDLLMLESMIDNRVNLKIVALYASYLQKKNAKEQQRMELEKIEANAVSQQQISQAATQLKIQEEQTLSQIRIAEYQAKINEDIRLKQAEAQFRTQSQMVVQDNKSQNKQNETAMETALG